MMDKSYYLKRKLAIKYDLTIEQVDKIIDVPFLLVKEKIIESDKKTDKFFIMMIGKLGKFLIHHKKRQIYKERYGKSNQEECS